jgi:hypothetical protein
VPVKVHYVVEDQVESPGWVQPNSTMNLPIHAVHTQTGELHLSLEGYNLSERLSTWRQLQQVIEETTLLSCSSRTHPQKDKFFIKVNPIKNKNGFENLSRLKR